MTCALLLGREIRRIWRSAVRLLDRSVSRAMGCFFGCFRVKDLDHDHHLHHRSQPNLSISDCEPVEAVEAKKNRLSSLFLSQDKEESPRFDGENRPINEELRDEAKFLKECGTLPETPSEIRKASGKLKSSPPANDLDPSNFHSWMPNTSSEKLQLDKRGDPSLPPYKICEEWGRPLASSEQTPSSCISNVQNTGTTSISINEDSEAGCVKTIVKVDSGENDLTTSASSQHFTETNQYRNKSVHSEHEFGTASSKVSSSENGSQVSKKFVSPGELSLLKPAPKPTPPNFSDDMQTPGTVFPANVEAFGNRKTRVRSQYVYSVLNPVENVTQWKAIKEEDFGSHDQSSELRESLEQSENASSATEMEVKEMSSLNDLKVEASVASWLKASPSNHDDCCPSVGPASSKTVRFDRTLGDRPIIGMVAAHWNENETSNISPKWWDGNGIPNSTNKYKEDQKVNWHATPFEERLEKALSEESVVSQKKHISGKPMVFDEESDTALSQLQTSAQSKSVVSF